MTLPCPAAVTFDCWNTLMFEGEPTAAEASEGGGHG